MLTSLAIRGWGAVGGFGVGKDALAQALRADQVPATPFPPGPGHPEVLPAYRADTTPLDAFIPRRAMRRADGFSRMMLLATHLAMEAASLAPQDLKDAALVIGSGHGPATSIQALLDSIIQDGDACSSPIHFANALHNAAATHAAILLGIQGPTLSISQGWLSVPSALLTAWNLLHTGRVERVLLGAVEELSDLALYVWQETGTLPPPGEGAACFILERQASPNHPRITHVELGLAHLNPLRPHAHHHLISHPDPTWQRPAGTRAMTHLVGYGPLEPALHLACACLMPGCASDISVITADQGHGQMRVEA